MPVNDDFGKLLSMVDFKYNQLVWGEGLVENRCGAEEGEPVKPYEVVALLGCDPEKVKSLIAMVKAKLKELETQQVREKAEEEKKRREEGRLQKELETQQARKKAEEEKRRKAQEVEEEKKRREEGKKRREEERRRKAQEAEEEKKKLAEERMRREEEKRKRREEELKKKEYLKGEGNPNLLARRAEQDAVEATARYLKKHLRIHFRDNRICAYLYYNQRLELFESPFLPKTPLEVVEFMHAFRDRDPSGYFAWKSNVEDIIAANEETFIAAKRTVLDFQTCLLKTYHAAAIGEFEEILLDSELPLLAWDKAALLTLPSEKLVPGPYYTYKAFLNRVSHPEELMRFVWKLFDPEDYGRQIAWSFSLGNSGQSTFWNAIYKQLEKIAVSMTVSRYNDKHTESKCYLKRFVMYPDCMNKHLYESNLVKKLSGADMGDIDYKHVKSFSAQLYARVVAHSNKNPEIDTTSNAMKTRLLYFTVKSFDEKLSDATVKDRYDEEFWHFLFACRALDRRAGGGPIPMPDSMWEAVKANCDLPVRNLARAFIQDHIEIAEGEAVLSEDMWGEFVKYHKALVKGAEGSKILGQKEIVEEAFNNLLLAKLGVTNTPIVATKEGLKQYNNVRLIPVDTSILRESRATAPVQTDSEEPWEKLERELDRAIEEDSRDLSWIFEEGGEEVEDEDTRDFSWMFEEGEVEEEDECFI